MPPATANAAIAAGSFGRVFSAMMDRLKPEAVYFTTVDGDRGGYVVFDLADPSDIPPVMTPQDVQTGLARASAI